MYFEWYRSTQFVQDNHTFATLAQVRLAQNTAFRFTGVVVMIAIIVIQIQDGSLANQLDL